MEVLLLEALFDHSLLSFCLTEVCILLIIIDTSGWGSESQRGHKSDLLQHETDK